MLKIKNKILEARVTSISKIHVFHVNLGFSDLGTQSLFKGIYLANVIKCSPLDCVQLLNTQTQFNELSWTGFDFFY